MRLPDIPKAAECHDAGCDGDSVNSCSAFANTMLTRTCPCSLQSSHEVAIRGYPDVHAGHGRSTKSADAFYERMVPLIQEINETAERVSRSQQALHGRLRITMPMSFGTMYLGPVIAKFAQALRVAVMKLPYASTAPARSALRCYLVFAGTCRQVGIALFPGRWMLREANEVLCNQKGTCRIGIR